MITVLAKLFVKETEPEKMRKSYGTLCSIVGILLNILLFVGKYFAGVISGSVAITADAFNNLSDAGSSFITMIGFVFAGKKPDPDHPFGHGRFEYVSGFIVSMAILFMGYELLKSSIDKILHPQAVDTSSISIIILLISIGVKIYMAFYNFRIGKQIDSTAMKATAIDSLSDTVATTVVLIAMIVMRYSQIHIDGVCGVVVALFIIYAGFGAAKDTMDPLLGQAPDREFVEKIESIVMSYDEVCGIHDLMVHDYGPGRCIISLHAEVPGNLDIFYIHDVIDCIEVRLREEMLCEAVIHMDPIETDNEEIKKIRKQVEKLVCQISEEMTIHDFRMVSGPSHTNLIFDAVLPYNLKMTEKEVKDKIEELIEGMDGNYFAVVKIDQSYI